MRSIPNTSRTPAGFLAGLLLLAAAALAARAQDAQQPPLRYARDRVVDVERLALDLDLDLVGRALSGRATLAGRTIASRVREIELDAVDLEVRAVEDEKGRALKFRSTGQKLVVTLDAPLAEKGAPWEVRIDYALRAARPDGGGLWFFGPSKDEPEVPLQVWSQGESEDARRWFPCVDTPEERQAIEVAVRVPAGLEALSNGALVAREEDEQAKKVKFVYRQKLEVPAYLVTLVAGKFAVEKEMWEGIPILYYVAPERRADIRRSFAETRRMLTFFSKKIGVKYPWEKYAQVCVEQFIHGGMENSSATTLMDRTLHDERAHLDYSSEGLVAHELAHQWWGDLLTCRDWRDIWLNEGFASFFEALWDEEANGPDEYAWNMVQKAGGALAGGRDLPIVRRRYKDPDETFGGGTYPKGAWFLHMLRRELGEDRFWDGIKLYCERNFARAVETQDLRRAVEEASGRSLGRFFDQWLERPGHPVLEVAASWSEDDQLLAVTVKQTQSGEPFTFTAEVGLGPDKPGGAIRTYLLRAEKKEERLVIPLAARPRWLSFDPRQAILRETTLQLDRDQLAAALEEDPSVAGRIEAARAILKVGGDFATAALGKALLADPFYAVRIEAAQALGQIGGLNARKALLDGLAASAPKEGGGTRQEAEVRGKIVESLGNFHKDDVAATTLISLLERGDPSYFVEAGAVRALARTRDPRAFEKIIACMDRPSHEEEIRTAAIDAVAELAEPLPRAVDAVKAWVAPGKPRAVRQSALAALGRLAARKEFPEEGRREIAATLSKALDESSPRVRGAAIEGLRELGASSALPALEALARHEPRESVRDRARQAVEKIRAGAPPDAEIARLREDLKGIVDENKALRDRLEKLEARGEAKGAALEPQAPPKPEKPKPAGSF